jgi:hypothetical protein
MGHMWIVEMHNGMRSQRRNEVAVEVGMRSQWSY